MLIYVLIKFSLCCFNKLQYNFYSHNSRDIYKISIYDYFCYFDTHVSYLSQLILMIDPFPIPHTQSSIDYIECNNCQIHGFSFSLECQKIQKILQDPNIWKCLWSKRQLHATEEDRSSLVPLHWNAIYLYGVFNRS